MIMKLMLLKDWHRVTLSILGMLSPRPHSMWPRAMLASFPLSLASW